jgi:folate-dependent phosphoribosylglycinamide formyltransferase PurN
MRVVILASSVYSETACAMAVRIAEMGHVPVGALSFSTLNSRTVIRKLGQWGVREVGRYARAKLSPQPRNRAPQLHNSHLQPLLKHGSGFFRSLREVAAVYGFPVVICNDQNSPKAVAHLEKWSPDLLVFTGGNILRKDLLAVPRLGVLNLHLGLLPEVRGMSTPEWSLLQGIPVGVTIHYIDAGIDTGPILQRQEFPDLAAAESLSDLRNRLIAFGVGKIGEVVAALDHGALSAAPQSDLHEDCQFFVMHEWLRARAGERLGKSPLVAVAGTRNG